MARPMCDSLRILSEIVKRTTAFQSLGEILMSMTNGYIPTIRPDNEYCRFLIKQLRKWEFPVYVPANRYGIIMYNY